VKNNVRVDFPEVLCMDEITGFDVNYRLLGLVTHMGTIDGGHYMSAARIGQQFFLFNDEVVQPMAIERVLALQAYLLFYERMG
jgi:ubiquitin C-terminal hydrolase